MNEEEQQENEEHRQMKKHIKMNNSNTKTSPEVLPSKVTSLGVFDF